MDIPKATTILQQLMSHETNTEVRAVYADICNLIAHSYDMLETSREFRDLLLPLFGYGNSFQVSDVMMRMHEPNADRVSSFLRRNGTKNVGIKNVTRLLDASPPGMFFERAGSRYRIVQPDDIPDWLRPAPVSDSLQPLQSWLNECCEIDKSAFTPTSILYKSFDAWMIRNKQKAPCIKQFTEDLSRKRFTRHRTTKARGFVGIKLKHQSL